MRAPSKKRSHWQQVFKQWQLSGLSQSAFCREHGLKLNTLNRWVNIFSKQSNQVKHQPKQQGQFIPVQIAHTQTSINIAEVPISIYLGSIRLEVKSSNLLETLRICQQLEAEHAATSG